MDKDYFPEETRSIDPCEPVRKIPGDEGRGPEPGMALCLSGGGYRAMLFHLGALTRINELGLLRGLKRISSVSGGSITAGVLGLKWKHLLFDGRGIATNFAAEVAEPIRRLAGVTIDVPCILRGVLLPRRSIADYVDGSYQDHLFGKATLQDLPDEAQGPRFVINATNVASGVLWRFSRPYMRDYKVGEIRNPTVMIARAVAASSAFPPVLSPLTLDLRSFTFTPNSGKGLQRSPYTDRAVLTDGGVYDNLGLETAWKRYETVLVSDGGGYLRMDEQPKRNWLSQTIRVLFLINNQVGALRKRQVIRSYVDGVKTGTYWGIRTDIKDYHLADAVDFPREQALALADTPTRLKALDRSTQEGLVHWGYSVSDAALRRHVLNEGTAEGAAL